MRISDWSSDVCSSDLVDLLRDHYFAGLKIGNHSQKLGAVGAGTRCLLSIDRRDIVACGLCFAHDRVLATQILRVGADAQIDAGNLWGRGRNVLSQQGQEIGRAHSELQSLMRNSYAVFCLKKKKQEATSNNQTDKRNIEMHQQK